MTHARRPYRPTHVYLALSMAALGVVAVAPQADAAVHKRGIVACVATKTGDVRIVQHSSDCEPGERVVRWRKHRHKGAQGDPGVQGPQGPQGAQGAQGAQGTQGAQGAQGLTGAAGSRVLTGTGAPAQNVGADGDYYIDKTAGTLYGPKTAGAWAVAFSLIGPQGEKGDTGAQGETGATGAKGDTGEKGDRGAKGDTGATGETGATGAMGPQGPAGAKGDTGATGAKGDTGAQGAPGATGATGAKGDTGATGAKGDTGAAGADGATLLAGSGAPKSTDGKTGDYYIDSDSGRLYGPKVAGVWPIVMNLIGPAGPAGATGATGPAGPQGATGAKGDTGAVGPAGAKGDTGAVGPAGPVGPTGLTGPAGPVGPAGPTGATGPAGPAGPAGTGGLSTVNYRVSAVFAVTTDYLNPTVVTQSCNTGEVAIGGGVKFTPGTGDGYFIDSYPGAPGAIPTSNATSWTVRVAAGVSSVRAVAYAVCAATS